MNNQSATPHTYNNLSANTPSELFLREALDPGRVTVCGDYLVKKARYTINTQLFDQLDPLTWDAIRESNVDYLSRADAIVYVADTESAIRQTEGGVEVIVNELWPKSSLSLAIALQRQLEQALHSVQTAFEAELDAFLAGMALQEPVTTNSTTATAGEVADPARYLHRKDIRLPLYDPITDSSDSSEDEAIEDAEPGTDGERETEAVQLVQPPTATQDKAPDLVEYPLNRKDQDPEEACDEREQELIDISD